MMTQIENAMARSISANEDLTIVGFRDDGLYEIVAEVKSKISAKFITVNAQDLSAADLDTIVESDSSATATTAIIIEDLDLNENPVALVASLDRLKRKYSQRFLLIYLIQSAELIVKLEEALRSNSSFFSNLFYQTIKLGREREFLENYCGERYGVISKKLMESAFEDSGGHYEIYKYLYKSNLHKNGVSLNHYLNRLVRDLGDKSIRVMNSYLKGFSLTGSDQRLAEIYMELGVLEKSEICIPAISPVLRSQNPKTLIDFDAELKQINFNYIDNFTSREIRVLNYLHEHRSQPCTKESIGKILWGEEAFQSKYSEWAIDQVIFRLRTKLEKYNLDAVIETIHGEGYTLR